MTHTLPRGAAALLCLLLAAPAAAQDAATVAAAPADTAEAARSDAGWDIAAIHGPGREIAFTTDEGTWMSVDVSPDGRTLVFDLLGDLYTMPAEGGEARLLLGGPAYELQPRWSPDGTRIAFTSDRDGLDNLWTVASDGSDLRQVTREKERQVTNPAWTPDGEYLVGRKHYRNTRSLGAGEMWLYHVGGGSGLQLTERRNWEQNATEPAVSPDGRYVYYSEDVSPGGGFQYNRDPHGVIYVVQRFDRETGDKETWLRAPGGSLAPLPSPDGRTLAFIRRDGPRTVLMLHDQESGRERVLWDGLDLDQQEVWAVFGTYPNYSWTPDGKALVIWAQGKLWRVDAETGTPAQIPFRAEARHRITDAVRFPVAVAPERFDVKMLRNVAVSPDGRRVAYSALGKLWVKELDGGEPRRVTREDHGWELFPAWSPDGRTLAYASWSDEALGAIRTVRADGRGMRTLTTRPGHYVEPSWSADGERVVFRRTDGDGLRGGLHARDTGIYWAPARGGEMTFVTDDGSRPLFSRDGARVFLLDRVDGKSALVSVDRHGADRRVHLLSEHADQIVPSPDGRYVAWSERFKAYVAPLPMTGKPVQLGTGGSDYPVRQISRDAGLYLHWAPTSDRVYWALGPQLFQRELAETFAWAAADTAPLADEPEAVGIPIGFQAAFDQPQGTIALVGATVIPMTGEGVIENATVLVEGNRIAAVGPTGQVQVPAGAERVDARGKYVMPGIIDAHAHVGTGSDGIVPEAHWGYLANLAFGVTTMHDPSSPTETVFYNSELIKAGELLAPRLFSTGTILYGADTGFKAVVNEYDDALSHLRRMQSVGAFSVKSYNQPRRDARQQIVEAARELGMMVVPEGGATFHWNMTHVLDGHTGMEHNIPVAPLYNDVLTLIGESRTGYTPTLLVNYNGLNAEYHFYQEAEVWKNERLARFTPAEVLVPRSRRRAMAAADDYSYLRTSAAAKDILDHGGKVQVGAHGQLQGLGAHWELWALEQGGMTELEALRAATLHGAEYLGLDGDLGSVEPGKLADLLVLDANPLDDIRNTTSIRYVMANGRLYDADTLAELGNEPAPAPARLWQQPGRIGPVQAETHGH